MSLHRNTHSSLLPRNFHNPELLLLFKRPIDINAINALVQKTVSVIAVQDEAHSSEGCPAPPPSPIAGYNLPSLDVFITRLVYRTGVKQATLWTTLIYLDRLKAKLPKEAQGMACTRHRVFLAILIVATKYLNDSPPKNIHWAQAASLFNVREVNLMEKQLLYLLDYNLRFDEAEICRHLAPFMSKSAPKLQVEHREPRHANIDKAYRGRRARTQTQTSQDIVGPIAHSLASSVRDLAKRLSHSHLATPPEYPARSVSHSSWVSVSSASDSDPPSLVTDDSELSSGPSPESEPTNVSEDDAYSSDNGSALASSPSRPSKIPATVAKTFLRKASLSTMRLRKASDTSSIRTVIAQDAPNRYTDSPSPLISKHLSWRHTSGRVDHRNHDGTLPTSHTTGHISSRPSARSNRDSSQLAGTAAGFLSRMWGAATTHKQQQSRDIEEQHLLATRGTSNGPDYAYGKISTTASMIEVHGPHESQAYNGGSTLRRLIHSRSTTHRNTGLDV